MPDEKTELELLKMRVKLLEKETEQMKADVHRILGQLSAVRYILIGVIVAESPQTINSIMQLLGVG